MGFWDSYWKWLFSDEESFMDLERGIFYHANGNTRSIRGMFRNFELTEKKPDQGEAIKLLHHLLAKGKITEEDLLEYQQKKKERILEIEEDQ